MVYNLGVDGRGGIRVVLVGDSNQVQKDKLLFFFLIIIYTRKCTPFYLTIFKYNFLLSSLFLDKINQ